MRPGDLREWFWRAGRLFTSAARAVGREVPRRAATQSFGQGLFMAVIDSKAPCHFSVNAARDFLAVGGSAEFGMLIIEKVLADN